MIKIKQLTFVLLILAIVYLLVNWVLIVGEIMVKNRNTAFLKDASTVFLGTLFTALFLIIGNFISRVWDRRKRHRNALVKMEYNLMHLMNVNQDNIFILNNFIAAIDAGALYNINFKYLDIDKDILTELGNVDFINDVFKFNTDTYRIDESLRSMEKYYNEFKSSFLEKNIDRQTFDHNVSGEFKNNLVLLKKSMNALDGKIEVISAKSVVLFRLDETLLDWVISIFSIRNHYAVKFEELWKKRLVILKKEREESRKKSSKELEDIFKG